MGKIKKVSVHGGHSGQFCDHARNSLEEIVQAYIDHGYSWVGITEHIPPSSDDFLYPEEIESGLTAEKAYERFADYIKEGRRLQKKYESEITLFIGMEIECYSGYKSFVARLFESFKPDYMVGSIHHIYDLPFDYSAEEYQKAVQKAGSVEKLYCDYFDLQYEMLGLFNPAVVGHFDIIRMFDPDYPEHLRLASVMEKIERNLEYVKENNLILDLNLRSLQKGAEEPYISLPILQKAHEMGISVIPGDDSHGVSQIDLHFEEAVKRLVDVGFSTKWQMPAKL